MAIITDGVRTKFTDDTGLPLIGGQVFSYVEGTSTPKDTYQDRVFAIPNTNPIILDDAGSCQMYLKGGYRLRVLTADGVLVEEKDNAFQSDGQVLDVVANTTAIAALQTNVDVLNTRGGLKTDEHNHVIGQGKAESATVYDLSLRSDKVRVSAPNDIEFGSLVFKTYDAPTVANGVTIPKGTWFNPALVVPLLGTAATKNVGVSAGQIPLAEDAFNAAFGEHGFIPISSTPQPYSFDTFPLGSKVTYVLGTEATNSPPNVGGINRWYVETIHQTGAPDGIQIAYTVRNAVPQIFIRAKNNTGGWFRWYAISTNKATYSTTTASGANVVVTSDGELQRSTSITYTNTNTTKDSNGFIKAASPIVKVFADKVELNDEAVDQDVTYKKNGVGDYTITTASGLSTDGWYIELPKDMNGNPKVAVTLEETDGVISLKTYKRIFSMETFTFEPDLDSPLDIPDGRWIDLRLNELPVEPAQQTTP